MNKTLLGILSAVVLLNTACSPKEDATPNTIVQNSSSAQSSWASSASMAAISSVAAVTSTEANNPTNSELQNTYWKLVGINEKEATVAESQNEPHIIFNAENRMSGSDGCNRLTGSYQLDDNRLTLGEITATKMACAEGAEQTQAFNDVLEKVATYTLDNDQLILSDANGQTVARFKAVELP